jgi:GntR family transcriptional regulator
MALWLQINPRSGVPLYLQLVEQINHALAVGILRPGEALPTVRELAKSLAIAPNTISKAYGELETQGLIVSRAGAGTMVSPTLVETMQHQAREDLRLRLSQLVRDAASLGISAEEFGRWFTTEQQHVWVEPTNTTRTEKESPQR